MNSVCALVELQCSAFAHLSFSRTGIVNYLADEGQTATERAVILAQEVLKAGECFFEHDLKLQAHLGARRSSRSSRCQAGYRYRVTAGSVRRLGLLTIRVELTLSTYSESGLDFEATCYQTILKSTDRLEGLKA